MGTITVESLGKAFKQYGSLWGRLADWVFPSSRPRHKLKWVLRDVSFAVKSGEALGIVGVNGAGKSTLLKLITGTAQPTIGHVKVAGKVSAILELGMGFHPDFTGRQNAYMAGQLLGYSVQEISELMPRIEAFAEIGEYIDQPVRVYSSGMQVRLAFSVATMVRPDVLIVDEALSVGDAYFQAKCYKRIAEFRANGTTLLLVSHNVGDIVKHCDRAILLKGGRVEFEGNSREVTNLYLDELFGKKIDNCKADHVVDGLATFQVGMVDSFHTRPGYRKEEYRWGHGGAAILDYLIISGGENFPSRIEGNEMVYFHFTVKFDEDYANVVPGFLIKTLDGIFLYGTNSHIAGYGYESIAVSKGDVRIFSFAMPLALNAGDYLVSLGVSVGDPGHELVPLDRRYDSVMLHIERAIPFWGVVDLRSSFSVSPDRAAQVNL